jgi:scyllo-inositol 2-dehydrogenase (NADP+)
MKFLVIGFGKMGMLHAATLGQLPGVSKVVIAETSPLVRRAIAQFAPSAEIVDDYRTALGQDRFDGAVIATPTASHAPIFKDLINRVRGIFIEKPFASSYADAADAAAGLSGQTPPSAANAESVMIGHCLRYSAVFQEAKRLLGAGALGQITRFDATMFSSDVLRPAKSWRFKDAQSGGGVLLDLGSHLIDMTRYFFGTPARLTGKIESLVSVKAEDAFESEWLYSHGLIGKLTGSWSKKGCRKAALEIHVTGSNGRLSVCDDAVEYDLMKPAAGLPAGAGRSAVTALEQSVPFDLAGPMYARQLEAWVNSLSTSRPAAANTLEENLMNLKLIDAIRSSQGIPVNP